MGFYDSPYNVEQYTKMADGYEGQALIEEMRRYTEMETDDSLFVILKRR